MIFWYYSCPYKTDVASLHWHWSVHVSFGLNLGQIGGSEPKILGSCHPQTGGPWWSGTDSCEPISISASTLLFPFDKQANTDTATGQETQAISGPSSPPPKSSSGKYQDLTSSSWLLLKNRPSAYFSAFCRKWDGHLQSKY